MRRKILHGLQVSEFIHPEEEKKKQDALSNEKVQQFLNSLQNGSRSSHTGNIR